MKCCVSTDVGTWTNWLTFELDPDYSLDAGTGLLSPISYKPCYAEFYVGKIQRIRIRRCSEAWFYNGFIYWGSELPNTFVKSTCAPQSALPVFLLSTPATFLTMSPKSLLFNSNGWAVSEKGTQTCTSINANSNWSFPEFHSGSSN